MTPPAQPGALKIGILFGCSVLSAPGQSYAVALYLEPIGSAVGVSRVQMAALFAGATIVAAAALPLVARLADRWTARRYLATALAMIAAALLILSMSSSVLAVATAFFLLRLLCQGALGVGTLTAVVRWFRTRRGRTLAVVGWRLSLAVLGLAYVLLAVPILVLFLREPQPAAPPEPQPPPAPPHGGAQPGMGEAARSRAFWLLAASMAVAPLALTGILLHQPAIFRSLGWGADSVPTALRAYAVASLSTAYVCGWLLERVPTRWGVVASLVSLAAAVAVPAWAGGWSGALYLYASLLGVAAGSNSAANGLVWPEYFGLAALGSIKGVVSAIRNGGTAIGAAVVALLGEGSGYALPLAVCAGIALVAAVVVAVAVPAPQIDRASRVPQPRLDSDPCSLPGEAAA